MNKKIWTPCIICGFEYFTQEHHIIKRVEWGANTEANRVSLCPNHHKMADNFRFEKEMLEKIRMATGKVGERLSEEQTQRIKDYVIAKIKTYSPMNAKENTHSFQVEIRQLIEASEFYRTADGLNGYSFEEKTTPKGIICMKETKQTNANKPHERGLVL